MFVTSEETRVYLKVNTMLLYLMIATFHPDQIHQNNLKIEGEIILWLIKKWNDTKKLDIKMIKLRVRKLPHQGWGSLKIVNRQRVNKNEANLVKNDTMWYFRASKRERGGEEREPSKLVPLHFKTSVCCWIHVQWLNIGS